MNENYNTPNSGCCGRNFPTAPENKCNYNNCCMNEYTYKQKACIRNKQPDCEAQAVIPSITVETVDGITNLANCFVHVSSTNTTYYVDDKHRIMITWAGPVEIPDYDYEDNPDKLRSQILYTNDSDKEIMVYYDKNGNGTILGDHVTIDDALSELSENPVQNKVITAALDGKQGKLTAGDNVEISSTNEISAIIPNVYGFDAVADMKASTELKAGDYAITAGYYTKDDGGAAKYKIRAKGSSDVANDRDLVATSDASMIAEIEFDGDLISVKQFGAKGNKTDDDSNIIQATIDYASTNNITNVYMPKGDYLVTKPLILYNFVNLKGENRENTTIFKSGHLADDIYGKDCILTATKKTGDSLNYPRYIEIDNVQLQSLDRNDQSEYGLYIDDYGAYFTITHFASRYTGCCMDLGIMWLSTIKEVSTGYGTIGFQTRGGTTLSVDDIFTNGNSQYGYCIQGTTYSNFSNMACDGSPNSIAYYFAFANITIDGLGCEAKDYTNAINARNSRLTINEGEFCTNETDPDATLMVLHNSMVRTTNCVFGPEKSSGFYSTAGKFLQFVGVGTSLIMEDFQSFTKFETANIDNNANNTITIIDKNNIASVAKSRLGYVGSSYPLFDMDNLPNTDRLNLSTLQSQLSAPCSDVPNSAYDNESIAWERDNRPVGALVPNVALNRSGTVMFVKSSESKVCQLVNPIETVNVGTNATTLTFSSIALDTLAEFRLDKVNTYWRVRKVGGENKYTISSVDYNTGTIVVNTTSESFEVGDYIELFPPRDVRECSYIPVQGVLKGATANRPQYPKEGTMYLDTTLGKPIWRIGSRWVDATGTTV